MASAGHPRDFGLDQPTGSGRARGLLHKAKSSATQLTGNDVCHPWKFEPFRAHPWNMLMHTP